MLSVVALGFAVLTGLSRLVEHKVERELTLIQERFIPLIALGPKLEQGFERLRRGLQDAVAAQDVDALNETEALEAELLRTVAAGRSALPSGQAERLGREIRAYYTLAFDVSRRLLAGESGGALPAAMLAMQSKHAQVQKLLRSASALDHDGLARAFAEASEAQRTASRTRLAISLGSLGIVLLLSLLISRGLLRSLAELGAGLARFGRGDFSRLIQEQGDQELLQLARQANQMAENLQRIGRERDRQEEQLRQMNAELSARGAALISMSNYKSQFLANMSHELRTPLNSMLVLSALLADNESGNLSAKQVEYCKTIHGAGGDLLALINQVLDLAKIEAGKQQVSLGDVALDELCDYARRIFEPLARDKGLSFSVELAPDLPAQISSDRRRIEQILNNLLGNAIKFTERGHVVLRIERPAPDVSLERGLERDSTLALAIEDTGTGIPREHQERIFAAFEQLDGAADRRYGGTGLGLSIARELALLLGGEVRLHSAPGQGSTFTCYLPFAPRPVGPDSVRPSAATPESAPDTPRTLPSRESAASAEAMLSSEPVNLFHGATILVAEDDMRTLYALSALLHAKGADVLTADNGPSALEQLTRHPGARAVLLDMTMPERGGYAMLRALRAQPRFAHLPVIALTARGEGEREQCLKAGASAQLTKPVDGDAVCQLLHELLALPQPLTTLADSA
jgi:signal transduction histidine kinase/ActR/RegA family two-component response regulator